MDVDALAQQATGHSKSETKLNEAALLETLVRQELFAQRAEELGLDKTTKQGAELERRRLELEAFRRKILSEALVEHEAAKGTTVEDAEVRAYFDANEAELRTEVHVFQLFKRSRSEIDEIEASMKAGRTFEEVAAEVSPPSVGGQRPVWDLGFLRHEQIPDAWRAPLKSLQPGQTTEIISGPRNRYWIIKLVERRTNDALTFEEAKPVLVAKLRAEKRRALSSTIEASLRARGTVTTISPMPGK